MFNKITKKGETAGRGKSIWDFLKHSRHYHDYFEGYAERQIPGPDGSPPRIERVYVGEYYRQDVSNKVWVLLRIGYIPLYLLGSGFFLYTGSRQTQGIWRIMFQFSFS